MKLDLLVNNFAYHIYLLQSGMIVWYPGPRSLAVQLEHGDLEGGSGKVADVEGCGVDLVDAAEPENNLLCTWLFLFKISALF